MPFVKVKLLVKDKSYTVEIDDSADAQALAQGFVEQLDLPRQNRYHLHLVDSLNIHQGATLALVETKPRDLFKSLKEDAEP
jgi:hypothetical protein